MSGKAQYRTRQITELENYLCSMEGKHVTVSDICKYFKSQGISIGTTTVYRQLDRMVEQGLVEEVKALRDMGCRRGHTSMQGLGYKEIFAYLDGECTLEEAKEIIKRDTRHFAKRQITWFKRERDVIWINKQEYGYQEEKILERILKELKVREIFPQKEEEIK